MFEKWLIDFKIQCTTNTPDRIKINISYSIWFKEEVNKNMTYGSTIVMNLPLK